MSRTGIEAKPRWNDLPKALRQQVNEVVGAPITRAARIWGGYSPTPTYRLALADGRRAFFKGTYQESSEFAKNALLYERRIYHEFAPLLGRWIPQLYATFDYNDWQVLLLEDLGPKSVPPWTPSITRAIVHALADFHRSSSGLSLPEWLSRPDERLAQKSWTRTLQESSNLQNIAGLAGDSASQALQWLQGISPKIEHAMNQPVLRDGPYSLLHGDLRSDNIRFTQKRLYLFDWPAITVGRPEWDLVAFAQTITVEGGPLPEQVIEWYKERLPLKRDAIECAIAWWFTFFADYAWRPEIPGLPRLRHFQRQQLAVLAAWAARHWSFPAPQWIHQLEGQGPT